MRLNALIKIKKLKLQELLRYQHGLKDEKGKFEMTNNVIIVLKIELTLLEKILEDEKIGIDQEYLLTLVNQVRCKNNGIIKEISKKAFQTKGEMVNGEFLSFEYLKEKTTMIDMLLSTIQKDILESTKVKQKFEN